MADVKKAVYDNLKKMQYIRKVVKMSTLLYMVQLLSVFVTIILQLDYGYNYAAIIELVFLHATLILEDDRDVYLVAVCSFISIWLLASNVIEMMEGTTTNFSWNSVFLCSVIIVLVVVYAVVVRMDDVYPLRQSVLLSLTAWALHYPMIDPRGIGVEFFIFHVLMVLALAFAEYYTYLRYEANKVPRRVEYMIVQSVWPMFVDLRVALFTTLIMLSFKANSYSDSTVSRVNYRPPLKDTDIRMGEFIGLLIAHNRSFKESIELLDPIEAAPIEVIVETPQIAMEPQAPVLSQRSYKHPPPSRRVAPRIISPRPPIQVHQDPPEDAKQNERWGVFNI